MTVRRALIVPGLAHEGPRDHAADGMLAGENLPRAARGGIELFKWNRLLVGCDLEHRVGGGVNDPLACSLMLLAELLNDLRPRRGLVPDHAAPGLVHEWIDHVVRESVRVRRHRLRRED